MVLSRAFASLQDMMQSCRHLLATQGRFLAMKGELPTVELEAVSEDCSWTAVYPLSVPGLGEHRHLVEMMLHQNSSHP